MSINRWMDKQNVTFHTYTMQYHSVLKTDRYPTFVTMWVNLEYIMLSEISKSQKDKCYMIPLT